MDDEGECIPLHYQECAWRNKCLDRHSLNVETRDNDEGEISQSSESSRQFTAERDFAWPILTEITAAREESVSDARRSVLQFDVDRKI